MHTEITRRVSPEEEELAKKREELALLHAELADRRISAIASASIRFTSPADSGTVTCCSGVS
jgi:uncharacterized coiled-coil protein SlyX